MAENGNKIPTFPISLYPHSEGHMSYVVTEGSALLFVLKAALVLASKFLQELGKIIIIWHVRLLKSKKSHQPCARFGST